MGSCFVENIGDKLEYYKFQNTVNPFGVVFHPIAIEKLIERSVSKTYFTENDIFFHNGQWHCFEVHSLLSNTDKIGFLKMLNDKLDQLREGIISATHIIFTYGTAWVYRFLETKSLVANCHKIPQDKFLKELLSINEISESIKNTVGFIKSKNPNATIIATVSPVRHIKDGFVENSLSKAHLISAIHASLYQTATINKQLHYFPSFEIMMDELRDYRFYAEDMLHPNKTAISIIWEKFSNVWVSPETKSVQEEIASIQSGLHHRPFNPESAGHLQFLEKLQEKISSLQNNFPHIKF